MDTLQCIEGRRGEMALSGALLAGDDLADAREALLESLAQCEALEVDLSGVTAIDERGAELLVRLRHEALLSSKPFTLVGISSRVGEALDGMQLGRALSVSPRAAWS